LFSSPRPFNWGGNYFGLKKEANYWLKFPFWVLGDFLGIFNSLSSLIFFLFRPSILINRGLEAYLRGIVPLPLKEGYSSLFIPLS